MAKRSSRHAATPTYRRSVGTRQIELLQPRVIPLNLVATQHTVAAHERLDSIANRYFSDPLQYWRIADANPSDAPEDLLEPGAVLEVPEAG